MRTHYISLTVSAEAVTRNCIPLEPWIPAWLEMSRT